MINVVEYRGYYGVISYSQEDELYVARAVGIGQSYISCHGDTLDEAKEEFKISIDFHLEVSEAEGWPPCMTDQDVAREMDALLSMEGDDGLNIVESSKILAFAQ